MEGTRSGQRVSDHLMSFLQEIVRHWAADRDLHVLILLIDVHPESARRLVGRDLGEYGKEIRGQLDSGDVRVLAVFSDTRMASLPEVPTVKESGYDLVLTKFRGLAGRRGTPPEIIATLETVFQRLLADPEYRAVYEADMLTAAYLSHDEFTGFVEEFVSSTEGFLRETGVIQ